MNIASLKVTYVYFFYCRSILKSCLHDYIAASGRIKDLSVLETRLRQCLQTTSADQRVKDVSDVADEHGATVIHHALRMGHTGILQCIFSSLSLDDRLTLCSMQEKHGMSALHCAASSSIENIGTIEYLLSLTPLPKMLELLGLKDKSSATALHYAAERNKVSFFKCLGDYFQSDDIHLLLTIEDNYGMTPLHIAVRNDQQVMVQNVLDMLSDKHILDLIEMNSRGKSLIYWATQEASPQMVLQLLRSVTFIEQCNLLLQQNTQGRTLLQNIIMRYDSFDSQNLIETMFAPRDVTTKELQLNFVDKILKIRDREGSTLAHWIASKNLVELFINIFRKFTVEELTVRDYSGRTPLHFAVLISSVDSTKYIFESISVSTRGSLALMEDVNGSTALHMAVGNTHQARDEIVKLIIRSLPEDDLYRLLKVKNSKDMTVLHRLAFMGYTSSLLSIWHSISCRRKYYLAKVQDKKGYSLAHYAALRNDTNSLKGLFEALSPKQKLKLLNLKDSKKQTPLELKATTGNQACLLLQRIKSEAETESEFCFIDCCSIFSF